MKLLRSIAMFIIDNIYVGRFAPKLFGFAINKKFKVVNPDTQPSTTHPAK
jgi:hypothetical protein